MGDTANPHSQHKIVILNPKGGSGKTTLATNLASYCATRRPSSALVDRDPGGYGKRPASRPSIHGVAGYNRNTSYDNLPAEFPHSIGNHHRLIRRGKPGINSCSHLRCEQHLVVRRSLINRYLFCSKICCRVTFVYLVR
jgi:hypothetical protein